MQPVDLQYRLKINSVVFILEAAPMGWEEGLINHSRSEKYFGLSRNYTTTLNFHSDGAYLIRKEFYTNFLKASVELQIYELNKNTWNYDVLYTGDLDFSTFDDKDPIVEINCMESGISEKIKAFEKVVYSLILNSTNSIDVRIPGVGLTEKAISVLSPKDFAIDNLHYNLPHIIEALNNIDLGYVEIQNSESPGNVLVNALYLSDAWFLRATQGTRINLSGNMKCRINLTSDDQEAFIQIRNSTGELKGTIGTFVGTNEQDPSIEFSLNIDLVEDEKIYMVVGVTGQSGQGFTFFSIFEGDINITNSIVTPATVCKAIRPGTLFRELIKKMNEGLPVSCRSFLLDSTWSNLVLTSGDSIRQLDNPKLHTSFVDFFDSINAILCAGFGIENGVPTLEHRSYWFKADLKSINLGTVDSVNIQAATSFIYNTIKTGYSDNDYEVDYGREEFNSSQQWTTPLTRIQSELDLISPYRADQFGIEEIRITPGVDNVNSKDSKSDNDTFALKIQKNPGLDGIYDVAGAEDYRPVDGIKGLSERQSYYNLDLTPKKNLLRHGSFIRAFLHRFDGSYVRFESGEKNVALVTIDLENKRVAESEAITIGSLADRMFLPYIFKVKTKLPTDASALLKTNPTGVVVFTYMGVAFEGFFIEASINVPKNSEKEWILLASPNVDMSNFIE